MQRRRAARILGQIHGDIGHGQSIADDEYGMLRGQVLRHIPRVMPIRRVAANRGSPRQQRRGRVARRQNHAIRQARRPVGQFGCKKLAGAAEARAHNDKGIAHR
jgi:hypothetical protein